MAFQFIKKLNAKIVQLVECFLPKEEVASSSLVLRLFQIFFVWCLLSVSIFASTTCTNRVKYTCSDDVAPKYLSSVLGLSFKGYFCCPSGTTMAEAWNEAIRCVKNGYVSGGILGNSYCRSGWQPVTGANPLDYVGCCPKGMNYSDGSCRKSDGSEGAALEAIVPYSSFPEIVRAKEVNEKYCASGCKDDNEGIVCTCYAFGETKGDRTCAANGELKKTSEITEQDLADIQFELSAGDPQKPITNGEYCTNQALDAYTRKPVEGEYAKCLACMGGNSGAEGSTTGYTYTAGQCFGSSIDTLPTSIARLVVGLGIGLLFIKITMAGLSLLLGNDSPQKLKETKEEIFAIITAFIFLSMGLIVLRYIGYDILKLGDFLPSGF